MKNLIVICILALALAACGGDVIVEEKSEADFLIEFCEAQGMDAQLLYIFDIETGEYFLDVECIKRQGERVQNMGETSK